MCILNIRSVFKVLVASVRFAAHYLLLENIFLVYSKHVQWILDVGFTTSLFIRGISNSFKK